MAGIRHWNPVCCPCGCVLAVSRIVTLPPLHFFASLRWCIHPPLTSVKHFLPTYHESGCLIFCFYLLHLQLAVLVAVAICGYFLGGWSERVPSLQECGLLRWCGKEDSLFLWCHERVCAAHLQDTARGPMNEFGLRVAIPEGERSSSKAWTMQQGILDRQRLDEETTRLVGPPHPPTPSLSHFWHPSFFLARTSVI